eukprot:jgi/Hompol1/5652/HPOL_004606-RA
MLHNYVTHGDPGVHEYIRRLLVEVSAPFYRMLKRWIYEGELEDPFGEFFVTIDPTADNNNLWRAKYAIEHSMVPAFISKALAKKIFSIGKSLNFVRHSCHDHTFVAPWSQHPSDLQYGDISKLEFSIDSAYQASSNHLLSVLFNKYRLGDHLFALKRYLLLGQGDFVQYLMDSLGSSLSKPAGTIYRHNLTGTLESAIRMSNAQFDDPDILKRLDVRLLEATSGDLGWDIFALDYLVDSPTNTILTPQAMHTYLKLFTFLWRLKRVEHALSSNWQRRMTEPQALRYVKSKTAKSLIVIRRLDLKYLADTNAMLYCGISRDIQQCFILQAEMLHFINQLQHYVLFEVIECSWNELVAYINRRTGDLDLLIAAHNKYLNGIAMKGLLAPMPNQVNISTKLLKVFDVILSFDLVQESVFHLAAEELAYQQAVSKQTYENRLEDEYNLGPTRVARESRQPLKPLEQRIRSVHDKVQETVDRFHTEIKTILAALAEHSDQSLKLLGTRLNFNEVRSVHHVAFQAGRQNKLFI